MELQSPLMDLSLQLTLLTLYRAIYPIVNIKIWISAALNPLFVVGIICFLGLFLCIVLGTAVARGIMFWELPSCFVSAISQERLEEISSNLAQSSTGMQGWTDMILMGKGQGSRSLWPHVHLLSWTWSLRNYQREFHHIWHKRQLEMNWSESGGQRPKVSVTEAHPDFFNWGGAKGGTDLTKSGV